jgi:hypothetical protein
MNRSSCVARSVVFVCLAFWGTIQAFSAQSTSARLPFIFEPNRGQAAPDVRYLLRGGGLGGEFRSDSVSLTLPASARSMAQVRMRLIGANKDSALEGASVLQGQTNYLMGNDPAH